MWLVGTESQNGPELKNNKAEDRQADLLRDGSELDIDIPRNLKSRKNRMYNVIKKRSWA